MGVNFLQLRIIFTDMDVATVTGVDRKPIFAFLWFKMSIFLWDAKRLPSVDAIAYASRIVLKTNCKH